MGLVDQVVEDSNPRQQAGGRLGQSRIAIWVHQPVICP